MFVIVEGMVRIERNREPLGKLRLHDYFGELGVLLESRPGYPLPRLRSAYALTPNTFLALLTFEDLMALRHELPALDHAVEMTAKIAMAKHPSLHPTLPELEEHDPDDLLPPPTLGARASARSMIQGGGDENDAGSIAKVQSVLDSLGAKWASEQATLDKRMHAVEAAQEKTQQLLVQIEAAITR